MYVNGASTTTEEKWLDEGLAHIAEDLNFYKAAGRSPRSNIDASAFNDPKFVAAYSTYELNNLNRYHVLPAEQKISKHYYVYARADIDFILRYYPNHPQALLLLVQLCNEPGQRCDLDMIFETAVAINPNAAGTYVMQGLYLHRVKRYADAIKVYKSALSLNPNSVNAHYNLGLAYIETKQYALANEEAGHAYALGAPLPGLRDRLKQLKQWKPVDPAPSVDLSAPDVTEGASAAAGTGKGN
jgi:tetratricopeptide (TPR) repeat protein